MRAYQVPSYWDLLVSYLTDLHTSWNSLRESRKLLGSVPAVMQLAQKTAKKETHPQAVETSNSLNGNAADEEERSGIV
jgi:hypothetical protein